MSAISKVAEMLEIIIDMTNMQAKLEIAQESGNKSEETNCKKELEKLTRLLEI